MPFTKPTTLPEWNSGGLNRVEPSGGEKALGWEDSQTPPSSYFNWLLWIIYQWLGWLKENTESGVSLIANWFAIDGGLLTLFPSGYQINAVASSTDGTVLVAVGGASLGSAASLARSSNGGGTWGGTASPTAQLFYDVVYGGAIWVAVGENNSIITSPDGVTWTARASALAGGTLLSNVAWNGALFVCVSANNLIQTSPDGINWTARVTALGGTPELQKPAWNGTVWLIGSNVTGAGPHFLTSPDGITWTARSYPTGVTGNHKNPVWAPLLSGGLFVSQAATGGGIDWFFYTSPDGITWTQRTAMTTGPRDGVKIAHPSGYIVIALDSNGVWWRSEDGLTWRKNGSIDASLGGSTRGSFQGGPFQQFLVCQNRTLYRSLRGSA